MPEFPQRGSKQSRGAPPARRGGRPSEGGADSKSSQLHKRSQERPQTAIQARPRQKGGSKGAREPPKKGPAKQAPPQLDLSGQQLVQPPSLADYGALSKLNLSNCGLTEIGFVKQAAASLTWLNVSGNNLSGPAAWDGVESLSTLFVLNASHCQLTVTPRCVGSLKSLKALVLSHNALEKLEHVANLPELNTIVVSNNALEALPKSLATLPSLKKISAAHNRLSQPGLPDLSSLSHLHELRLNDNRPLSSLPPHFGSWGKADPPAPSSSVSGRDASAKPRRGGLEILDLGNCGFESWFGLRELAKQDGIVNLGLKGNKVAEEAIATSGFENFREKLTILLPALRILDTHRFDSKHAELKAARSSRTAEQKILDAGPMALALNAQSATPLEVAELLKARERERENRRRRRKGIAEEVGEGRKRRRDQEEELDAEERGELETASKPSVGAADQVKGKKRRREGDADVEPDEPEEGGEDKPKKPKKRSKAERKALAKARAVKEGVVDSAPAAGSSGGRALDALRGDDSGPSRPSVPSASATAQAAPEEARPDQKQKTSVAKIIEVRRPGDKKKGKKAKSAAANGADGAGGVDVGALLGLTPAAPSAQEAAPAPAASSEAAKPAQDKTAAIADPLAALGGSAASGSGLFGGGGWD